MLIILLNLRTVTNNPGVLSADNGAAAPKLVISEEEYDRITQALVLRLRQHEETVKKDCKLHHSSVLATISCSPQRLKQMNSFSSFRFWIAWNETKGADSMVHRSAEREKEVHFARASQTRYQETQSHYWGKSKTNFANEDCCKILCFYLTPEHIYMCITEFGM